jgi:16S rRNA (uracil1498-N3)-methyltransferase
MTAPFFLVPVAAFDAGPTVVVTGPEGRHAVSVRRLRVGEAVDLGDGSGGVIAGRVAHVDPPDRLVVDVLERARVAPPRPRVIVVQGLPKGDRGELAVSLMTEVGVDAIVPWAAARCVARWQGDRGERSWQRWSATARESAKQARRPYLPTVTEPAATGDVAALVGSAAAAVVLHEESTAPLAEWVPPVSGDIVLVVGPEGGITAEELHVLKDAGAEVRHAGPAVMRTSTAGAAAASVVLARAGRWS